MLETKKTWTMKFLSKKKKIVQPEKNIRSRVCIGTALSTKRLDFQESTTNSATSPISIGRHRHVTRPRTTAPTTPSIFFFQKEENIRRQRCSNPAHIDYCHEHLLLHHLFFLCQPLLFKFTLLNKPQIF